MRTLDIDDLEADIGSWANEQFPHSTDQSRVAHLKKELVELEEAIALGKPDREVVEEAIDIIFICLHLTFNRPVVLSGEIARKFAIVQQRRYPDQPGPDGVTEHLRD